MELVLGDYFHSIKMSVQDIKLTSAKDLFIPESEVFTAL